MNFEQPIEKQTEINPDRKYLEEILGEILKDDTDPLIKRYLDFKSKSDSLEPVIRRGNIEEYIIVSQIMVLKNMRTDNAGKENAEEIIRNQIKKNMINKLRERAQQLPLLGALKK